MSMSHVHALPTGGTLEVASEVLTGSKEAFGHDFDRVYDEHFHFVWRSVRRLGVDSDAIDDVTQEIFIVVHRRLAQFEARATLKTWIFGIALHVVRDHRRTARRKRLDPSARAEATELELIADSADRSPDEEMAKAQAVCLLHRLLDELDDDKREVFVLAELEQLSAPEIAEATGTNVNTVYSRLRAARQGFEEAVARHHARDRRRVR